MDGYRHLVCNHTVIFCPSVKILILKESFTLFVPRPRKRLLLLAYYLQNLVPCSFTFVLAASGQIGSSMTWILLRISWQYSPVSCALIIAFAKHYFLRTPAHSHSSYLKIARNMVWYFLWMLCYLLTVLPYYNIYCNVPCKRSWALNHNSLFFTTLGAYLVYWALTMCQIMHKTSWWSQRTIVITMAIRSRSPLASVPVSHFWTRQLPFR